MNPTTELASFVVSTDFDSIPKEVTERAKELILDVVGATVLGATTPTAKMIMTYIKEGISSPDVTIMGTGARSSVDKAAFANGSLMHSTELEAQPMGEAGITAPTILTPLLIGEKCRASGKDVLTAFVLGYELQGRIRAATPGIARRGFVASPIVGTLGAAASASKILGLNAHQISMALGIATSQAGGLIGQSGSITHFTELGVTVRNGIESAMLAQLGVTAMANVLENPQGFCHVFAGADGYDLSNICQDLGKSYLVITPEVFIKKYPCCFRNHQALDALFYLIKEHKIAYDQVESVEAGVNKFDASFLHYTEPTCALEAQFCLNHSLGAAILKGKPDWQSWSDEAAVDPKFKEARGKVRVVYHPEWPPDQKDARSPITLKLKDGRILTKEFDKPKNPNRQEVVERYKLCIGALLPADAIERSIGLILNLDKVGDISQLMDSVRGGQ